jgi:soluble lytic murein transglycosylase-like protein
MAAREIGLVAALGGALWLLHQRAVGAAQPGPGALSETEVRSLARSIVSNFGLQVDPDQLVRIAWIESSFDPGAVRPEPHINDASAGLMQTLEGTAQWLAGDMGYDAFGARPTLQTLMGPQASLYYGAAYLEWLKNAYNRGEEWTVRAYNGGPGGADKDYTRGYWRKYLDAKERFG